MSNAMKIDNYLDSLKIGKCATVDSWFMMSSPVPIIAIVIAYLTFVRFGPKIMRNKSPVKMDKIIMYYNAFQVILSVYLCYKALTLNLFAPGLMYAGCNYPKTSTDVALLSLGWWYAFGKLTELLDTIFFVIRKKDNQITFLHVYHHGLMAIYAWSYLKFAAAGDGAIMALLNSAVHVVMYSYYFLAGLGPKYQKYLWWKKYVTTLQMIQFFFMMLYYIVTYFNPRCNYDIKFSGFIFGNILLFFFLFYNFYNSSYKNTKLRKLKGISNGKHLDRTLENDEFSKLFKNNMNDNNIANNLDDGKKANGHNVNHMNGNGGVRNGTGVVNKRVRIQI